MRQVLLFCPFHSWENSLEGCSASAAVGGGALPPTHTATPARAASLDLGIWGEDSHPTPTHLLVFMLTLMCDKISLCTLHFGF